MRRQLAYASLVIAAIALWGIMPVRGAFEERQERMISLVSGFSLIESESGPKLDVPYVPTPHEVVRTMLSVADVNKDDVLYDLGCGDGRIVVTAAQHYGVRGTGVDIDPERIRESNENARKAGVADKVRFLEKNLFDVDLSAASVVTLYLLSSVNLDLRPKLFKELKPGTRVVSHDFDMGDWKPDQKIEVDGHAVYYWVIPANAGGAWSVESGKDKRKYTLRLKQKFQKVTGTLESGGATAPLSDVEVKGAQLRFALKDSLPGLKAPARFSGRIEGNRLTGDLKAEGGEKLAWSAQRDPATATPLDKEYSRTVQVSHGEAGSRASQSTLH